MKILCQKNKHLRCVVLLSTSPREATHHSCMDFFMARPESCWELWMVLNIARGRVAFAVPDCGHNRSLLHHLQGADIWRKKLRSGSGYDRAGEMAEVRMRCTVACGGSVVDDKHGLAGEELRFVTGADALRRRWHD